MTKKLLYFISFLSILTFSCQKVEEQKVERTLKGKCSFKYKDQIVLQQVVSNAFKSVDSTNIQENGDFEFKYLHKDQGFFRVLVGENQFMCILTDNNHLLNIGGTAEKPDFILKNNPVNDDFIKINEIQLKYKIKSDALNEQFIIANQQKDLLSVTKIKNEFDQVRSLLKSEIKSFVNKSELSIVTIYAAEAFDIDSDFKFLDSVNTLLQKKLPQNDMVIQFSELITTYKKTAIGQKAPDFSLPDPFSRPISLSDFKGKILIVDFWASWCGPCRQTNPEMVQIYNKYQPKGLEILGVSLDKDMTQWKNAIQDDQLKWKQVSDLKGWESDVVPLYNIGGIPMTLVLDKSGIIIGKNLHGKDLEDLLDKNL